jgi:putative ABC transport system permease protein
VRPSLADERVPFLYLPFQGEYRSDMTLHVRTQAPAQLGALISNLRGVVRNLDRDLPLSNVGPMRSRMGFALTPARLAGLILGISAVVALALAVVGVYGVTSFVVSRRTNEIGIRLALGAAPSDVRALLMRQAMTRIATGLAIGLAMSTLARRALASLLYGISGTDPLMIGGVSGTLVAVALLANYVPIRRAMKVDPAIALRQE